MNENNNTLQLVTFTQAQLLKKHGFDYPTDQFYVAYNKSKIFDGFNNDNTDEDRYSCSTTALALQFYRERYEVHGYINFYDSLRWTIHATDIVEDRWGYQVLGDYDFDYFSTSPEAESSLLDAIQAYVERKNFGSWNFSTYTRKRV